MLIAPYGKKIFLYKFTFQYVVSIFDDNCYNESSTGIQHHQIPYEGVVAEEEASLLNIAAMFAIRNSQTNGNGQKTELHISHPNGHVRAFQDLLKDDVG